MVIERKLLSVLDIVHGKMATSKNDYSFKYSLFLFLQFLRHVPIPFPFFKFKVKYIKLRVWFMCFICLFYYFF